jgi:general secretion pathway protein I
MTVRRNGGFTLLEMLAALVLFAVAGSVLLVAFGQSARSLQQARGSDRLSLAARSLMDEQRDTRLLPGVREGRLDDTISWRISVSQQPASASQLPLLRVDLRLREGRQVLELSTLVLQNRPNAVAMP